jgi:hypothetical protein
MIDGDTFWSIIHEAGNKTTTVLDIPKWLVGFLKEKPVSDIRDFAERRLELQVKAYDARLWTAAYLMMDGCGDDTFVDFRDWLICQGKSIYERALDNPDTLADIDQSTGDHGRPLLFAFGSVAVKAHEEKTGSYKIPVDFSKYRNPPLLNSEYKHYDTDPVKLSAAFPRLYARHGERIRLARVSSPFS